MAELGLDLSPDQINLAAAPPELRIYAPIFASAWAAAGKFA
ncbi:hypothetical protein [Bradyrhizobium centrosematis]